MSTHLDERRVDERRAAPRVVLSSTSDALTCRVNPGHEVVLLNVSPVGAFVESGFALRPGRALQLHVQGRGPRVVIEGRVVRCVVVAVTAHRGVKYRAGLMFLRWVDLALGSGLASRSSSPSSAPLRAWHVAPHDE